MATSGSETSESVVHGNNNFNDIQQKKINITDHHDNQPDKQDETDHHGNQQDRGNETDHHGNQPDKQDETDHHGNQQDRRDEVTDELAVLERRFTYRIPEQHYYRGIMWNNLVPIQRLVELETFQAQPNDVIVTGYPKSGKVMTD